MKILSQDKRKNLFPIARPNIWNLYKKGYGQLWHADEIKFKSDASDYKHKLNNKERRLIDCINGFFSQTDQLISETVSNDFSKSLGSAPEVQFYYSYKATNENVHVETYNRQIIETITDADKQQRILDAVARMPAVANITEWITNALSHSALAHRMVASICTEAILFSAQFAIIYWFRSRGLLMGTAQANEWISGDENLHAIGDIVIMKDMNLLDDITPAESRAIFISAIDAANNFVDEMFSLGGVAFDLPRMTRDMAKNYVRFIATHYFHELYPDEDRLYDVQMPFKFMEQINLPVHANFFEHDSTEYNNNDTGVPIVESDDF